MQQGTIHVETENIFPIIKKFLYSDHEIFLRELVSNAIDATQKVKTLNTVGEIKSDVNKLRVEVILNKDEKTLTVRDNGIGMTAEEIEKYITQIAFSGAEEFVNKYKDADAKNAIIGHFGLGFYSAFMVAERVDIISRSQKPNSEAVKWSCDGSPNYSIEETSKKTKGTDIVLHIAEDSVEFLEEARIQGILSKYCKFMPVEIKFGQKSEWIDDPSGAKDDEGKIKRVEQKVDNIVNNTNPAWTKTPASLKEDDYKNFYRELYPMTMDDPLFNIHLNVDYPFNLTGVLYFPKLKSNLEMQKNKIHLYSNQVFITDNVENIVPEFLTLLHGVIDSPDIPLNVSRSYLQEDANVKKISSHITKKVADKLSSMFKKDRPDFESKWKDIEVFVEYGGLTDEKFYDKSEAFALFQSSDDTLMTYDEMYDKIKATQKDKNDNVIVLYASNKDEQHSYITAAKERGYEVIILDSPLSSHVISKIESKKEKVQFKRVDADIVDRLIEKDEDVPSKLTEEQQATLKPMIEEVVGTSFQVSFASMSTSDVPMTITQPEFMRRMKEQQAVGGGGMQMFGEMPDSYSLVVNSNHPLCDSIIGEKDEAKKKDLIKQTADLAKLGQGMLKGEELTKFIQRSVDMIK